METIELYLKVQALQIELKHIKKDVQDWERTLEFFKKSTEEIRVDIKDINFRLSKNFLSFETLGKRLLFLASVFGALQILFRFGVRFFK